MIGESNESCLAEMEVTGQHSSAALSTSGLRALELPEGLEDVIVLADGDEPGESTARDCAGSKLSTRAHFQRRLRAVGLANAS